MSKLEMAATPATTDDAVRFHDQLALAWEEKYGKGSFGRRLQLMSELLSQANLSGQRWLDAGCGTGTMARWLASRGAQVTAVDASEAMIAQAQRAKDSSGAVDFRVSPIENLPANAGSVHGIVCSSVLEYVAEPERCLAEFARVLVSGGILLVSVPNARSAVRKTLQAARWCGRNLGRRWLAYLDHSRHEYAETEFATMLSRAGFRVSACSRFGAGMPRLLEGRRWAATLLMYRAEKIPRVPSSS